MRLLVKRLSVLMVAALLPFSFASNADAKPPRPVPEGYPMSPYPVYQRIVVNDPAGDVLGEGTEEQVSATDVSRAVYRVEFVEAYPERGRMVIFRTVHKATLEGEQVQKAVTRFVDGDQAYKVAYGRQGARLLTLGEDGQWRYNMTVTAVARAGRGVAEVRIPARFFAASALTNLSTTLKIPGTSVRDATSTSTTDLTLRVR